MHIFQTFTKFCLIGKTVLSHSRETCLKQVLFINFRVICFRTTTTLRSFDVPTVKGEGSVGTVEDASIVPRRKSQEQIASGNVPLSQPTFSLVLLLLLSNFWLAWRNHFNIQVEEVLSTVNYTKMAYNSRMWLPTSGLAKIFSQVCKRQECRKGESEQKCVKVCESAEKSVPEPKQSDGKPASYTLVNVLLFRLFTCGNQYLKLSRFASLLNKG